MNILSLERVYFKPIPVSAISFPPFKSVIPLMLSFSSTPFVPKTAHCEPPLLWGCSPPTNRLSVVTEIVIAVLWFLKELSVCKEGSHLYSSFSFTLACCSQILRPSWCHLGKSCQALLITVSQGQFLILVLLSVSTLLPTCPHFLFHWTLLSY